MTTWIQTYTGRKFFPLEPKAEDICIEDIAHALANVCRFCGHCRNFYSVAQHCVLVSYRVAPEHALWGLLHDASEAYICDLARPVKRAIEQYREIEKGLDHAVARRFGIVPTVDMMEAVKVADLRMLATERRDLMGPPPEPWVDCENVEAYPEVVVPWGPLFAERMFLKRFSQIVGVEVTIPYPWGETVVRGGGGGAESVKGGAR